MSESLGLLLVRAGLIDRDTLYQALELQRQTGRFLGSCLVAMAAIDPEALKQVLSQQLGIPAVASDRVLAAPAELAASIGDDLVRRLRVLAFAKTQQALQVALYSPEAVEALAELAFFVGQPIQGYLSDEPVVERGIARIYPHLARALTALPQAQPSQRSVTPPASPLISPPQAAVPPRPQLADHRRPEQMLRGVEEISNRDFGRALGLDEEEPRDAPIPLTSRVQDSVPSVQACTLASIVDAADRVFGAETAEQVALIAAEFLLGIFERVLIYDLGSQPARLLCRAGQAPGVTRLDVSRHPVLAECVEAGQGLQGRVSDDDMWSTLYADLGLPRPGFVLIAPIFSGACRWLCLADAEGRGDPHSLHDAALIMREITTALSILDKNAAAAIPRE